MSCGILVTQPGIKPVLSALEVCGLNHCTVGEVPKVVQLLGKMVLSQQEGLDSSSRRTPWGLQGWGGLFPPYPLLNSSLKYLGNSNLMHIPELFCRGENHHQVGEINYLMIMNKQPPDLHSKSRIDKVNPCNITLLPHHQPIRELCSKWSHKKHFLGGGEGQEPLSPCMALQ